MKKRVKSDYELRRLTERVRREMGISCNTPVKDELLRYLESQGIIVCHYPFKDGSNIDANITIFHTDEPINFIGLNSSLYYDEQIFALAHELYHYLTESGLAYRDIDEDDKDVEEMADRFASELLLPRNSLEDRLAETFAEGENLRDISELRALRFIAQLQVEYWLPYRLILKRLQEEKIFPKEIITNLSSIKHRDVDSNYSKILKNINPEIYALLNSQSRQISVSKNALEKIVRNYEDGYIEDDEFVELLAVFDKTPPSYGFDL